MKHGNASGSQPSATIAPDPTVRFMPTCRSEPPNAASKPASWATVTFPETFTDPESSWQKPPTTTLP